MKVYTKKVKNQDIEFVNPLKVSHRHKLIFNPTEEQLNKEGWFFNEEKSILLTRNNKAVEISNYHSSFELNYFSINGNRFYLTKDERAPYLDRIQRFLELGKHEYNLYIGEMFYTISTASAKSMFLALEERANLCFNISEMHLKNINVLTSIESIENYNYKTTYPANIEFKIDY